MLHYEKAVLQLYRKYVTRFGIHNLFKDNQLKNAKNIFFQSFYEESTVIIIV